MFPESNIFIPDAETECLIQVIGLFVPNIYSNSLSQFKSFEIEIKKSVYCICYLSIIVIQGQMFF